MSEECEDDEVAALAHHAHQGQTRRSGLPYVTHPEEVARLAQEFGYEELIMSVAMLHDTLEDYEDVEEMAAYIKDACPDALPIVRELTHEKGSDYTQYVLSLSPPALQVKLLDMLHNSSDLQPGDKQYLKYQSALQALVDANNGPPSSIKDEHWGALASQLGMN